MSANVSKPPQTQDQDQPRLVWGKLDKDYLALESRYFADMESVQGVLALVAFADYVDRNCDGVVDGLHVDAISRACGRCSSVLLRGEPQLRQTSHARNLNRQSRPSGRPPFFP